MDKEAPNSTANSKAEDSSEADIPVTRDSGEDSETPEPELAQTQSNDEGPSLRDTVAAALEKESTRQAGETAGDFGLAPGQVTVQEARRAKPLRVVESDRTDVRVLFITCDTDVLQPGTATQQHYADLAQFVGEVHILVLKTGRGKTKTERPMRNVWVYQLSGAHALEHAWEARRFAKRQLSFNGVVQPDAIVATDPVSAGAAAWAIAWTLARPWQLHLSEDIFSAEWVQDSQHSKGTARLARFILGRAKSIRTSSDYLKQRVEKRLSSKKDIQLLPHLFNLSAYRKKQETDLHDQYPQYKILLLAAGRYSADSTLHEVFAALNQQLHRSYVGLLIRGSGTAKQLFTEKVQLLGIEKQVVFLPASGDPVAQFQSADVFIETALDKTGDERVLRAIAAGTAVVAYRNDFRASVITDGESGFLCDPHDSVMLGHLVRRLQNDTTLRRQFARRAADIAQDQLHEDVRTYYLAFRDTISTIIK